MRFSLQEVKKQVHRRKGELAVSLHFLRPGDARDEIARLIAFFEQLLGQPQRAFSRDDARACVGDYRLADCLIATLSAWYTWRQPDWERVVGEYGDEAAALLAIDCLTNPGSLRLALFSYVNERNHGFVDNANREAILGTFAATFHVSVAQLEYLLALDHEDEAVLARETPEPPNAQEVATLYNQWAFEAALFNASSVTLVIDCAAFERESEGVSGVGAVIKRLCFLARKLGVYYDINYDGVNDSDRDGQGLYLRLTLYGPQEMTGAPQQYGFRLARLCRILLGYRRKAGNDGRGKVVPAEAIVEAGATIHFLQRAYHFAITRQVLALLPSTPEDGAAVQEQARAVVVENPASAVFDSGIEQDFAETFATLTGSQAVDGWSLVREPEPLLLEQSIFIPDFALTRDARRIYMEILGFWTPSYRERKVQKLQQLRGRGDIALAIPVEAREAFAAIATQFPIVYYHGQLSATDVLQMLRVHFDDSAQRLAAIDVAAVRRQVEREGFVPERACYTLLHCYRRSELALAAERVAHDGNNGNDGIIYSSGVGLYSVGWMEHLQASFVQWLGVLGVQPLAAVLRECRERWPALAACEDVTLEALFSLWPAVIVSRSSIFDATIRVGDELAMVGEAESQVDAPEQTPKKKVVRERKATYKKRGDVETAQGDLWR